MSVCVCVCGGGGGGGRGDRGERIELADQRGDLIKLISLLVFLPLGRRRDSLARPHMSSSVLHLTSWLGQPPGGEGGREGGKEGGREGGRGEREGGREGGRELVEEWER